MTSRWILGLCILFGFSECEPVEKTVRLGSKISIPCELDTPGDSLQWLLNGKPVVLDVSAAKRRHWNISREGIAALTINDVTRADEGVWECQEIRSDGYVKSVAEVLKLTVSTPPDDPYLEIEGRRLVHQATLTIQEYTKLQVQCVIKGAVPPVRRVQWTMGSGNLTGELFVEVNPEDDTFTSRSVLELNVSREQHRNELICQVFHVTWLSSSAVSASLNVLYTPSFSITREPGFGHPIIEGMSVSLKCEIDANPLSNAKWFKDETVEASSDGYLNFTAIQRHSAGWYRCATVHKFGTFTSFGYFLNVRYGADIAHQSEPAVIENSVDKAVKLHCSSEGRPEVSALNKSLLALAGSSAQLVGHFCANPTPARILWVIGQTAIGPNKRIGRYQTSAVTRLDTVHCFRASLNVKDISEEDSGEILLVVQNVRGIGDVNFLLNVTGLSFPFASTSRATMFLKLPFYGWMCLVLLHLFDIVR